MSRERVDQVSVDPDAVAFMPNAADEHVFEAKLARRLVDGGRTIPEPGGSVSGDDGYARKSGQIGDQVFGHAGCKPRSWVVAERIERQYCDRWRHACRDGAGGGTSDEPKH